MPAFLLPEGRAFSPPQARAWEPSPAAEQTSGRRAAAGPDGGAWAARRPPAPHGPSGASPHAPPPGSHGDSRHGGPTGRRSAAAAPAPAQMGHGDGGQQHPPQGGKRRAYTGACRGGGIGGQCRLRQQEQSHQAKVCFFHPCHSLYIQILRTVYHARRPAVHAPAAIF